MTAAPEEMVAWLRGVLDDIEQAALAASGEHDREAPRQGEHWRWECGHCDVEIDLDAGHEEFLTCPSCERVSVDIRSVEKYERKFADPLSHLATKYAEEIEVGVGRHIILHDPAKVLDDVRAKWAILDLCESVQNVPPGEGRHVAERVVSLLAWGYRHHNGYRPEWGA